MAGLAAAADLPDLREACRQPTLSVHGGAHAVSVKASFVSIHELLGALGKATGVEFRVATGVWGLVRYDSGGPTPLAQVLWQLRVRYGLAFEPILKEGAEGERVGWRVSPLHPEHYFAPDNEFFAPHVVDPPAYQTPKEGIHTGRFYLDGHFIPPLYALGVRGVPGEKDAKAVTINGVSVEVHRIAKPASVTYNGEIRVPKGVTTINTGNIPSLMVRKFNYWVTKRGREKALAMFTEFLKSFGPVKEFKFGPKRDHVTLVSKDGDKEVLMLTGPPEVPPPPSPAEFQKRVQSCADSYVTRLRRHRTVLVFTGGTLVSISARQAPRFHRILEFLTTCGHSFDRRLRMDLLSDFIFSSANRRVFVANFSTKEGRRE